MATDTAHMRSPLTPLGAEFELTGPQAVPSAIDDANVYPIAGIVSKLAAGQTPPEVEELWSLKWRFTGPTADDADCNLTLWLRDAATEEWYPVAKINAVGLNLLSTTRGGVFHLPGVLGTAYIGIQVEGLVAGDTIHILHRWA